MRSPRTVAQGLYRIEELIAQRCLLGRALWNRSRSFCCFQSFCSKRQVFPCHRVSEQTNRKQEDSNGGNQRGSRCSHVARVDLHTKFHRKPRYRGLLATANPVQAILDPLGQVGASLTQWPSFLSAWRTLHLMHPVCNNPSKRMEIFPD